MSSSISSPLLLLSLPLLTVSTWTPKCDGTSEPKDLHGRSYALLHAHRCFLKDVPVLVSSPLNSIPDFVIPSHVVVPRCQGLCLGSLGSDCTPKRTKVEEHKIVVYVNATPYCTTIQLEHHRGPCRCECSRTSCPSPRQYFQSDSCSCSCLPTLASEKLACANSTSREWDSSSCSCKCRSSPLECAPGLHWDSSNCRCHSLEQRQQQATGCRVEGSSSMSREDNGSAQLYLLYLSLTAVGVVLLLAISLYCSVRRKPELPPTQYLVEGSCTLPRIDGLQGYTLPRVSEGGGYTLRLHAEDGGTLTREATVTY